MLFHDANAYCITGYLFFITIFAFCYVKILSAVKVPLELQLDFFKNLDDLTILITLPQQLKYETASKLGSFHPAEQRKSILPLDHLHKQKPCDAIISHTTTSIHYI